MPVDSTHPEYQDYIESWEECRLFYAGEQAVKAEGQRFIPKPECCTDSEYLSYVQRAFFFPALERTVAGLSGAIDRKAPTVVVPDKIEYIKENADGDNTSIRQFSKMALDELFTTGRFGILVERNQNGGRPYLTLYRAEDIVNWWYDRELGLRLVVLREFFYDHPNGTDPYILQQYTRYRVLRIDDKGRYVQEVHAPSIDGTSGYVLRDAINPTKLGVNLDRIPFVFCNVRSTGPDVNKPPLLDLVRKNAEHLRVSADYANSLYFTGNPILWVSGVKRTNPGTAGDNYTRSEFNLAIGSSRAVMLPTGATIGMLECSGHGVNPNRERAADIKLEMAVLGARLLESQKNTSETAEAAVLRQSGETSTLSNIVVNCSAAITEALKLVSMWESVSEENVLFQLNNDFIETKMDSQLLLALRELVAGEYISWDTFYYNLALGELTVPGRTADEERELIDTQPLMGSSAHAAALGWQVNEDTEAMYENDLEEREKLEKEISARDNYYRNRGTSEG